MAAITPSYVITNPAYIMPEIILQYQQASGFIEAFANSEVMPRLSEGTLYAYIKRLDIRTKTAAGQQAYNSLPSVTTNAQMISTPTYLLRVRGEYDHHDTAAAGNWGVSIQDITRLGARQGIFQQMRNAALYGFNPQNGEGLLNTNGATAVNLPPDSNGNDTVVTYDNGQMAIFLLQQIMQLKTRMNQLGIGKRITILGPQRVLGTFEYQNIVQVTQFQRAGAGSLPTAGVVKEVAAMNDDQIDWVYDDTLQGQGAGGNDAIIITIPEVTKPIGGAVNTNEFANVAPGLAACNIMLCDMAAPREITTPIAGGALDTLYELRVTSGWGLRPEAITVVSMQYQ